MKRISKIIISNYRAYYNGINIQLSKGENLLVYGENGSGKSSLYKGINSFINSFIQQTEFEKNKYKEDPEGTISIGFKEYNSNTREFEGEEIVYAFQQGSDNTNIPDTAFLKAAAVTKGFLDYKDLMRIYLHDTSDGNLFDLVVNSILRDHIFNNKRLSIAWRDIEHSFWDAKKRTKKSHKRAIQEINDLRIWLVGIFQRIVPVVNNLLSDYFDLQDITIDFKIERLDVSDNGGKSQWRINKVIKLKVYTNGEAIDDFEEFLNEAKLSAIAMCIFLAALKSSESNMYKILFLDDVFVGLDAGNRKPILRILKDKFFDYQIIISTYDRYWYNLASYFFKVEMPKRWVMVALYSGKIDVENLGVKVLCPILVSQDTSLEKAHTYLHDREKPDFPAAANYFRKYLEEILDQYFPKQEFTDDEYSLIERYELSIRMDRARKFLSNVHSSYSGLNAIDTYLHALLHPMSHFNEEDHVYRAELMEVERIALGLESELKVLKSKYHCIFDKGSKIILAFHNDNNTYSCEYILVLKENLYIYKDADNNVIVSDCECCGKNATEIVNGVKNNGSYTLSHSSILKAKDSIRNYLNNTEHRNVVVEDGYEGVFFVKSSNKEKAIDIIATESAIFG